MRVGVEPQGQRRCVGRGQRDAALVQQFVQGADTQAAVQVFVQQHLGQTAQAVGECRVGLHGGMLARCVPQAGPARAGVIREENTA